MGQEHVSYALSVFLALFPGRLFLQVGSRFTRRALLYTRCSETPGEDPYLSGQYAINFVKGFQEHPEAPGEVMASACCKHYVANSMDGSTVDGHTATRVDFDAVISEQDLVDSYLAPFQACVEEGVRIAIRIVDIH
eukprot:COSAG02_NODE_854_length_16499_cov_76.082561_6_plen_136_part_00